MESSLKRKIVLPGKVFITTFTSWRFPPQPQKDEGRLSHVRLPLRWTSFTDASLPLYGTRKLPKMLSFSSKHIGLELFTLIQGSETKKCLQVSNSNRPHSRYSPSLHAFKDWWDKSDVTWFSRRKTTPPIQQIAAEFLYSGRQKMGNCGWKWSLLLFCIAVATVGVLTASNNDIKLVETRTVHFAKIKSLFRLEGISKLIVLPNRITKIPRNIAFIPL